MCSSVKGEGVIAHSSLTAVGTGGDTGSGSGDGPKTHVTVLEIPSKEAPYDPARDPIMARVAQLLGEPLDPPPAATGAADK